MNFTDEEKRKLAEEMAAWQDVSNWLLLPKSLVKRLIANEAAANHIYKTLCEQGNVPPEQIQKAREESAETALIMRYFLEHFTALTDHAYHDLLKDVLRQLNNKAPETNARAFLSDLLAVIGEP